MGEYHFPVPGGPDEKSIVLFLRRHWVSFLGQFFLSAAMLIIPAIIVIALYLSTPEIFQGRVGNVLAIVGSIYYLVSVTVAFVAWLSFYYDIYIICDEEIIDIAQHGFFGRSIARQSILRVQDVQSNIEGIFPTLFSYGDVLVETAGEQSKNFLIKAVKNPQEVAAKVMELHSKIIAREQRTGEVLSGEGTLRPEHREPPSSPPPPPPPPPPTPPAPPSAPTPPPSSSENDDGEVSHDDLDQGGEIKFK